MFFFIFAFTSEVMTTCNQPNHAWRIFCMFGILFATGLSLEFVPERPEIYYWNPKYIVFVNLTSLRQRRGSSYLINLSGRIKESWGNNITVDFMFLELLSNEYKRSFIEIHQNLCDLVHNDKWAGRMLYNAGLKDISCPYPAGEYKLMNMKVPSANLPSSFPFTKGKINITVSQNVAKEVVAFGSIYFSIKPTAVLKNKNKKE